MAREIPTNKGKPLSRWTATELMAEVPKDWKDLERLLESGLLTDWQLACCVQHTLNNCTRPSDPPVSYDDALKVRWVPELLARLLGGGQPAAPAATEEQGKMLIAWSLFRSGAATFEEIAPMMDAALTRLPKRDDRGPIVRPTWLPRDFKAATLEHSGRVYAVTDRAADRAELTELTSGPGSEGPRHAGAAFWVPVK